MRTLILSAVLYLLGIAIVLLVRPEIMFKKDGSWKEFGTEPTHTLFPFWLLCIVWAIVSYLITLLVVGEYSDKDCSDKIAAGTIAAVNTLASSPEDLVPPLPIKTKTKQRNIINKSLPGYHVLNKEATEESGVPQYIYVGETPLKKPGYYKLSKPGQGENPPKYTYVGDTSDSE